MTFGKAYTGYYAKGLGFSSDDYYKVTIPSSRKVRIYVGNYLALSSESFISIGKSTDGYLTSAHLYIYSGKYNKSILSYNYKNNKFKMAGTTGYIDKYLTKGTYYVRISCYSDMAIKYVLKLASAPIPPSKVALTKATGGKKTAVVKWKSSKYAQGYKVTYSLSSKFSTASKYKTKTIKTKNKYYRLKNDKAWINRWNRPWINTNIL